MKKQATLNYYFFILKKYKKYCRKLSRLINGNVKNWVKTQLLTKRITILETDLARFHLHLKKTGVVLASTASLTFLSTMAMAQAGPFVPMTGANNPVNAARCKVGAFVDIDADGDLDFFSGTNKDFFLRNTGTATNPVFAFESAASNPIKDVDLRNGASSIAFADMDNDGDQDLALYIRTLGVVYYKNIGTPTLPQFEQQTGANNPFPYFSYNDDETVSLTDFDGDGDFDILSMSNGAPYIQYFENTGSVTSAAFTERTGASNPLNGLGGNYIYPVHAVGDVDKDGDFDLIIGEYLPFIFNPDPTASFRYFKNTGTSTSPAFVKTTGLANPFGQISMPMNGPEYGSSSSAPILADIDADGDLDFFSATIYTTIQYYKNEAAAANSILPLVIDNGSVGDVIRINGLGFSNTTSVKFNGTSATFNVINNGLLEAIVPSGATSGPISVLLTNGDTLISPNSFQVTVLTITGFTPSEVQPLDNVTITGTGFDAQTKVYFNGLLGTSTYVSNSSLTAIIPESATSGFIKVKESNKTDSLPITITPFVFQKKYGNQNPFAAIKGLHTNPAFVDIDNDGDLDLFNLGNVNNVDFFDNVNIIQFYKNNGTPEVPSFQAVANQSLNPLGFINIGYGTHFAPIEFVDIDGDGDKDVFVHDSFYRNTGTPSNPIFVADPSLNEGAIKSFGDLDGDGDLDMIKSGEFTRVLYYKNIGTSTSPNFQVQPAGSSPFDVIQSDPLSPEFHSQPQSVPEFADIDNDGDLDLVYGYHFSTPFQDLNPIPSLTYYRNTGTSTSPVFFKQTGADDLFRHVKGGFGHFSNYGPNTTGLISPAMADLDNDGDLDLVAGVPTKLEYYENTTPDANHRPVVTSFSRTIEEDASLTLTLADFSANFSDAEGDSIKYVRLVKVPVNGVLTYNNIVLQEGDAVIASELSSFIYSPYQDANGRDTIGWNASDTYSYAANNANVVVTITPVNDLPSIKITNPVANAVYTAGTTVTLRADVSDKDGKIVKVLFYSNEEYLGEDSKAPYQLNWTATGSKVMYIYAKVVDDQLGVVTTRGVKIFIEGCTSSGNISRQIYMYIPGQSISDMTENIRYPAAPNFTATKYVFEGNPNWQDNYGSRMIGFICAPESGDYTFWLSGDDQAELYLSTDRNPANKTMIASLYEAVPRRNYTTYPSQKSAPVTLEKGMSYFVMVLHKESMGDDHLSVAWTRPDNVFENPIAGSRLSPWNGGVVSREGEFEPSKEELEGLSVSPVPAVDQIDVTFYTNSNGTAEIHIMDALSNIVNTHHVDADNGKNTVKVSLNGLASGVYFVNVITEGSNTTRRIVVADK